MTAQMGAFQFPGEVCFSRHPRRRPRRRERTFLSISLILKRNRPNLRPHQGWFYQISLPTIHDIMRRFITTETKISVYPCI